MTPKQTKFAQAVASGLTQSDAYRSVYSAAKMKPETVHKRSSELMGDGAVKGRVDELRAELAERCLWSREDSVRAMIEIISNPDNQGCKINAVKVINEMQGFNAPVESRLSGQLAITAITRRVIDPAHD